MNYPLINSLIYYLVIPHFVVDTGNKIMDKTDHAPCFAKSGRRDQEFKQITAIISISDVIVKYKVLNSR